MLNIFDLIIIISLIMCFIIGFKNGFLQETVALIGTIIIIVLSYLFKNILGNLFCDILPFFNFTGSFKGLTSLNILLYQGIAFLIIFSILSIVLVIVLKISGVIQKIINYTIVLWLPSKIIGGIIGIVIGYIIIFIITMSLSIPLHNLDLYNESKLVNTIIYKTPILSKTSGGIVESLQESYMIGEEIGKNKITQEEANKKLLNELLKYNVVSNEEVNKLINNNKLKI